MHYYLFAEENGENIAIAKIIFARNTFNKVRDLNKHVCTAHVCYG